MDAKPDMLWERARSYLLWLALPLVLGMLAAALIPQPVIGVISLREPIYSSSVEYLIKQIDYARTHAEVRAVVLVLDSPGGTVVGTEAIYLELLKLREHKPVVVSIDSMAASGAYYLTVGSDYAFAKPTSMVGNVGVIGYLPPAPAIYEEVISTGPYKLWGSPRDTYMRQIEMIKQGFYEAVKVGRGGQLRAGPDLVLSGQIWPGSEALQLGLIDELGSYTDALEKAANLAHIRNYKIAELSALVAGGAETNIPFGFFAETESGLKLPYPREAGLYMLYIPPLQAEQK